MLSKMNHSLNNRPMKKLYTFLFALILLIGAFSQNAKAISNFGGGTGTLADPFLITTVTHLGQLSTYVNAGTTYSGVYFKQTVDIDCGAAALTPIGSFSSKSFAGTYNGNGFSISNFTITRTGSGIGLFGFLNGGTIKNLGLSGATITASADNGIGALVGWTFAGTIQNCYVTGCSVTGYSYVGGLVGCISSSLIIDQCYTSGGSVYGHDGIGGIVGVNQGGSISNCYSNTALTTSYGNMGGVIGWQTTGSITNSYFSGTIGAGSYIGGVLGNNGGGTITSSYWDKTIFSTDNGSGSGKTTAEMKTQSTYTGWDFTTTPIWHINASDNGGYPHLAWQIIPILVPAINSFSPASGAVGSSVTISGTFFNTTAANNAVYFGATKATVTSASATSLTVTVPAGASFQNISVTDLSTGLMGYSAKPFITTYTSSNTIDANAFAAAVTFTANGTGNIGIAAGDLDGDGKPDVVVTSREANTISVFLNTSTAGTVSFATKVDYATGLMPQGVRVVDIDGDGKLDIAVSNLNAITVSVFLNTSTLGSISFTTKTDFTIASNGQDVGFADIDGDGKTDLVAASGNKVSILRNTSTVGSISFAASVDLTASSPTFISTGDIDGDGKPDVVTSNSSANTISVFRNTSTPGTISFDAKVDYATAAYARGIAIGDLDGDGKMDVATSANTGKAISVFKNNSTSGSVSLAAKVDYTLTSFGNSVAFADIDGDGKIDVLGGSTPVDIFKNNSTSGSITLATIQTFPGSSGVYTIAVTDFDGDGKPDIATPNWGGAGFSVMRNTILGPFSSAPTVSAASSITTTGFTANWLAHSNATGYYLDVATDDAFTSMVAGYSNKDVANVTTYAVSGLSSGTNYYYQIRGYNSGYTSTQALLQQQP
jgi:hypothetical protein